MLGIYWATTARWMGMRAKRDAEVRRTPLFLLQAADSYLGSGPLPTNLAKKFMATPNPASSGGTHGLLPVHLGMRVRLLEKLDFSRGLVKDAEGVVVRVEVQPADQERVDAAMRAGGGQVYLTQPAAGLWLRMDSPVGLTTRVPDVIAKEDADHLIFLEPSTNRKAFTFKHSDSTRKVMRSQFPISHARVVTSEACQGRTMPRAS